MTQPGQTPGSQSSGLAPNVASLLCYVCGFITGIIFLVVEKENKDVRFHAWQSIVLGVAYIVYLIAFSILYLILGGTFLVFVLNLGWYVCGIGFFIIWIVAMIKAYQGERYKFPVIGDIAEKQAVSS